MSRRALLAAFLTMIAIAPGLVAPARAQDATFTLTIANNRFDQAELAVPANKKFVLVVKNTDKTPEEFESNDLRVEKVIPPGKQIRLTLGPLEPGRYRYFGDYHEDTANGFLVAK